jgi:hypothetical protein
MIFSSNTFAIFSSGLPGLNGDTGKFGVEGTRSSLKHESTRASASASATFEISNGFPTSSLTSSKGMVATESTSRP